MKLIGKEVKCLEDIPDFLKKDEIYIIEDFMIFGHHILYKLKNQSESFWHEKRFEFYEGLKKLNYFQGRQL